MSRVPPFPVTLKELVGVARSWSLTPVATPVLLSVRVARRRSILSSSVMVKEEVLNGKIGSPSSTKETE